jgi:hypothetical protein
LSPIQRPSTEPKSQVRILAGALLGGLRAQLASGGRRGAARLRGVRPGSKVAGFRRVYPNRRRIARGLYRARPGSPRLVGIRRGRVRFIAVADRQLLSTPPALRRYLRLAGVR